MSDERINSIKTSDYGITPYYTIWNPSKCECKCDKSCDVGEYLNYENCKRLVDKLVEEYTENVEEAKKAEITLNKNIHKCSSCTLYIVLFSIICTSNIGIATYFVYYKYLDHNKKTDSWYNYVYQATNY